MGVTGLEPPAVSPGKPGVTGAGGAKSGARGDADGLARVIAVWPRLDEGWRGAVLELVSRRERWDEYVSWSAGIVAKLVFEAVAGGWTLKKTPRPARTGSWYVTLVRGARKLSVRVANHNRPIVGVHPIIWQRRDEKALTAVLRELRTPDAAPAAGRGATA